MLNVSLLRSSIATFFSSSHTVQGNRWLVGSFIGLIYARLTHTIDLHLMLVIEGCILTCYRSGKSHAIDMIRYTIEISHTILTIDWWSTLDACWMLLIDDAIERCMLMPIDDACVPCYHAIDVRYRLVLNLSAIDSMHATLSRRCDYSRRRVTLAACLTRYQSWFTLCKPSIDDACCMLSMMYICYQLMLYTMYAINDARYAIFWCICLLSVD
jgi:hypothetical protein